MINAREMAPINANETMFVRNPSLAVRGGLAVYLNKHIFN